MMYNEGMTSNNTRSNKMRKEQCRTRTTYSGEVITWELAEGEGRWFALDDPKRRVIGQINSHTWQLSWGENFSRWDEEPNQYKTLKEAMHEA